MVLFYVSFESSGVFEELVTMLTLNPEQILPVLVCLVFPQELICYKCLLTLVTHVLRKILVIDSPSNVIVFFGWMVFS